MLPAWSYRRVSTRRQAGADRSGGSRQEHALAAWLADHPDYHLQEHLADLGVSGSTGAHRRRGALGRFLAAADSGAVPPGSVLVVESLTRFSREAERTVLSTLLSDFWARGIGLAVCSHGGVIYSAELIDAEPHRLHLLLGAMSQARAEADERRRRALGAVTRRRSLQDDGHRPPAVMPFWIERAPDGGLIMRPAQFQLVRRAVNLALSGLGGDRIAAALNIDTTMPAPPRAARWTDGAIRHLLSHPALDGTLHRGDRSIPGYYPAAITASERDTLAARAATVAPCRARSVLVLNLLEGISRCTHCGGPVSFMRPAARARAGHPGFICCRSGIRGRCIARRMVPADAWEAHCLTRLSTAVWEQYLGRPEDRAQLAELITIEQRLAVDRDQAAATVAAQERRAEIEWTTNPDGERLATIERALGRQRAELAAIDRQWRDVAEQLATARAQPSSDQAAAELREQIAEFLHGTSTASGAERLRFNRWLASRVPTIRFLLDTLTAPARVALVVGDAGLDWQLLEPDLTRYVAATGAADVTYWADGDGADWAG